jgi:hypothetical protein
MAASATTHSTMRIRTRRGRSHLAAGLPTTAVMLLLASCSRQTNQRQPRVLSARFAHHLPKGRDIRWQHQRRSRHPGPIPQLRAYRCAKHAFDLEGLPSRIRATVR